MRPDRTDDCNDAIQADLAMLQGWTASFVDTGVLQRGRGEPLRPLRYWFRQAEEAMFWPEVEKAMENLWAA
jgi:hypothetical protein